MVVLPGFSQYPSSSVLDEPCSPFTESSEQELELEGDCYPFFL